MSHGAWQRGLTEPEDRRPHLSRALAFQTRSVAEIVGRGELTAAWSFDRTASARVFPEHALSMRMMPSERRGKFIRGAADHDGAITPIEIGPPAPDASQQPFENAYGLTAATCGSVKGSVRCTTPSAYNLSIAPSDMPSICARISVVSSPIEGAPRQMRPGVSDIFGTTP